MVTDAGYMRRALFHAQRAAGMTTPNPLVGALVVTSAGVVAGQGRHARAGGPHAEVAAIAQAGAQARGASLYVTLEPCCHHGRTGPCTQAIVEAGIARVVAAMQDPNPAVSGRGFAELRAHGIQVETGVLAAEAERMNAAFITVQTRRRPLVMLKAATSLDARIAQRPGARTHLTSREANRRTHALRASADGVAVGSGTMLADDPVLTVRECHRDRPLPRVVFDRRLRTPPTARLFSTIEAGPVIMIGGPGIGDRGSGVAERRRALEAAGAVVVEGTGDLAADLCLLLRWDISCLLVEGGATLHAALWNAGVVDRVHLCVTPRVLGEPGVKLFDGLAVPLSRMVPIRVEALGPDTWMEADVHGHR